MYSFSLFACETAELIPTCKIRENSERVDELISELDDIVLPSMDAGLSEVESKHDFKRFIKAYFKSPDMEGSHTKV
jgi:hypothetical protein